MCSLIFYIIVAQIGANIAWSYRRKIARSFNVLKRQVLIFANNHLN